MMEISQEDRARGLIYVKQLDLINTGTLAAKECELQLEEPSLISDTSTVDTPFVFSKAGQLLDAPKFIPSKATGIAFEAVPPHALTFGNAVSRKIERWSWVAFVEAIGEVYTGEKRAEEYRYSRAVRVKELRAYCYSCLEEFSPIIAVSERRRPMSESLKLGLAVERLPGMNGEGQLGAICSLEKHPGLADLVRYKFNFSEEGEFILSPP